MYYIYLNFYNFFHDLSDQSLHQSVYICFRKQMKKNTRVVISADDELVRGSQSRRDIVRITKKKYTKYLIVSVAK